MGAANTEDPAVIAAEEQQAMAEDVVADMDVEEPEVDEAPEAPVPMDASAAADMEAERAIAIELLHSKY